MREGDSIDLMSIAEGSSGKGKRIRILYISKDKTRKENTPVTIRVWKENVDLT